MDRVFQNRALTSSVRRVLTDNMQTITFVNKLIRALPQEEPKRILTYYEAQTFDFASVSGFLEELVLMALISPPTDLGFLPPMGFLTRLTCYHVPGIQFPESLTYLNLSSNENEVSCSEIPFPPGLVELVLQTCFLPALEPEGLPKLDVLRIHGKETIYQVQRDWPLSIRVLARVEYGNFWLLCSRAWFQRHENLTRFGHVLLKVQDWVGYVPRAERILVSGFDYTLTGLTHLTHLILGGIWNEPKTLALLSQVRMTLQKLYVHAPMRALPEMPELLELACHAHEELLPGLGKAVPKVRVLGLSLIDQSTVHLKLEPSWLPKGCQFLGLNLYSIFERHIELTCPDTLQWLEITGDWHIHLVGKIPDTLKTLFVGSGHLHSEKLPDWLRFIPKNPGIALFPRMCEELVRDLSNKLDP